MKRFIFCSLLLLAGSTLLSAQSGVAESPFTNDRPPVPELGDGSPSFRFGDIGILYRFADQLPDTKNLTVAVRVTIDGVDAFIERLFVDPNPQAEPVVELFLGNLELADELILLSADPDHSVSFEMLFDDQQIEILSGIEMVARSESLKRQAVLPQNISSRLEMPGQETATAKTTCLECWQQYDVCTAQYCDQGMPPILCRLCETSLNSCLATCVDPPCEPWSETERDVVWLSYIISRVDCFYDIWPQHTAIMEEALVDAREDFYLVTHNCDGTITRTLTSSNYFQGLCYHNTGSSCPEWQYPQQPGSTCRF